MVSILIPVYNYDIAALVTCLSNAISDSVEFSEIVIGADGCSDSFLQSYKVLQNQDKVKLLVSKNNIGRAGIRNRLAREAGGSHLLFIDADALILSDARIYLDTYISFINEAPVICGGTLYREIPPDDPDKHLRWYYGHNKEQKLAKIRNKNSYAAFSGFNFLIDKEIFKLIKFDDSLKKYGHEDTLFGFQMKKGGISLIHIDNGLIHDGLEQNQVFLNKTIEGIENLSLLYDRLVDKKEFSSLVKILRTYVIVDGLGLSGLYGRIFRKRKRRIEIILKSPKASVRLFSLYKLGLLCRYRNNN